jgi:NAD(P)-dependent dehydrogenase (short-subunit alcohol dehydrogenase family)
MVCRDPKRGWFMRNEVAKCAQGAPPVLFLADLSSQAQVSRLAGSLHDSFDRIDVLLNNAGAMFAARELTEDGIERTLAVNHLAPFLLTSLIIDLLKAAPSGRVVTVASSAHSATLDFANLQGERRYNFLAAYKRSKLCNILFTYELARRLRGTRVTANCVSPGPTATRLGDNMSGIPRLISGVWKTSVRCTLSGARRRSSTLHRLLNLSPCQEGFSDSATTGRQSVSLMIAVSPSACGR